MDADEAAASGAHRGEFDPGELASSHEVKPGHVTTYEDMQIPGGRTESIWYFAARHLCPPNMNHTDRLRWMEGFVRCLEVLRGVNVELPGVAEVLLESIRVEPDMDDILG